MNDFTKEELEYLGEIVASISIAGHLIDDDALQSKIQSMIDNYCEHDYQYKDIGRVEICGKCERIREY